MAEHTAHGSGDPPLASSTSRVWLAWVAASVLGWVTGGSIGATLGSSAGATVDGFIVVAAGSLVTGLGQSLVLPRELTAARAWAVATIAAVGAVAAVVFLVPAMDPGGGAAAAGVVLGVTQWMVLRGRVKRAGWWVPASAVGWVTGGLLSGAFEGGLPGWATIGVFYGSITGAALVWLLRRRPQPPPSAGE